MSWNHLVIRLNIKSTRKQHILTDLLPATGYLNDLASVFRIVFSDEGEIRFISCSWNISFFGCGFYRTSGFMGMGAIEKPALVKQPELFAYQSPRIP
jgi:hypothetical protein